MFKDGQRDLSESGECDSRRLRRLVVIRSRTQRCAALTLDPGLAGRAHPGPRAVRSGVVPATRVVFPECSLFVPRRETDKAVVALLSNGGRDVLSASPERPDRGRLQKPWSSATRQSGR